MTNTNTKPPAATGQWGHEVSDRLTVIETQLSHLATRAWVLGGVVGGMVSAALIAIAFIELWQ